MLVPIKPALDGLPAELESYIQDNMLNHDDVAAAWGFLQQLTPDLLMTVTPGYRQRLERAIRQYLSDNGLSDRYDPVIDIVNIVRGWIAGEKDHSDRAEFEMYRLRIPAAVQHLQLVYIERDYETLTRAEYEKRRTEIKNGATQVPR